MSDSPKFLLDENIPAEIKKFLESKDFSAKYPQKGMICSVFSPTYNANRRFACTGEPKVHHVNVGVSWSKASRKNSVFYPLTKVRGFNWSSFEDKQQQAGDISEGGEACAIEQGF